MTAVARGGERWFIAACFAFLALTWWGVVLAELGWLRLATWLPLPVLGLAAVSWRRRRRATPRPMPAFAPATPIVIAALLAIGAVLYFPPFDVRLEARDPGVYYLSGLQLARTGSINWVDASVAVMSAEEKDWWFPPSAIPRGYDASRFMGFYMDSLENARVQPQALPVLPVWIAAGAMLGGEQGARAATPLLAVAAAVAVFFFAARWRGPAAGALAAVLLASSFPQAWFARYVAAEIPAQCLAFIGLYGLLRFRRERVPAFAWLAAGGLGLLWMTKIETTLLVMPLAALLLADAAHRGVRRDEWKHLWVPLGALGAHAMLHQGLFIRPYVLDVLWQFHLPPVLALVAPGAGALALVALALALPRVRPWFAAALRPLLRGRGHWGATWRRLLALAVATGFAYAYWLRPAPWYGPEPPGLARQTWNVFNLVELGWAVSTPVLFAALAGILLLLLREPWTRGTGVMLAIALPLVCLGIWNRQIWGWLPWAYRRWLPLVLPMVFIVGAWAAVRLAGAAQLLLRDRRALRRAVGAVAATALLAAGVATAMHQWRWSAVYDAHDELPGTGQWLRQLAAAFDPGDLLLFEPRSVRGLTRLEAVMALDLGLQVLRLPAPEIDPQRLNDLLQRQQERDASVYLVTTGYLEPLLRPAAARHHELHFESTRLRDLSSEVMAVEGKRPQPPTEVEGMALRAHVYRLDSGGRLTPLIGELDVGAWDDLYLSGPTMYESEFEEGGRNYRWSTDRAVMHLPGLGAFARTVIVRADPAHGRALPVTMRAFLDDQPLGEVQLVPGWQDYRLAIPPQWQPPPDRPPRLRLEVTPTIRPVEEIAGSTDPRLVGAKIDKVGWQPLEAERRR